MKKFIIGVLLLYINQSHARSSGFAHVTPESHYGIKISMVPVIDNPNKVSIRFNGFYFDSRGVWLIVASSQLSSEEQNLRSFIWNKSESKNDILIKAQLKTSRRQKNENTRYYEFEIDSKLINQSYIYIDYPSEVRDGGYYYSIDLATYFNKMKNTANKKINKDT
jgi:hypothetical protein